MPVSMTKKSPNATVHATPSPTHVTAPTLAQWPAPRPAGAQRTAAHASAAIPASA